MLVCTLRLVKDEPGEVEEPQKGVERADGMLVVTSEVLADLDLERVRVRARVGGTGWGLGGRGWGLGFALRS